MFIPGESLATASLETARSNHLLLVISPVQASLIWVLGEGNKRTGLFLNADHAGSAFKATGNSHWSGVEIGPVQVRVDPCSASSSENGAKWRLRAAHGSLAVLASIRANGLKTVDWLPIAQITTLDVQPFYFDHWSIGLPGRDPEGWFELVSSSGGDLASGLFDGGTSLRPQPRGSRDALRGFYRRSDA
jgi:hypothetical protein